MTTATITAPTADSIRALAKRLQKALDFVGGSDDAAGTIEKLQDRLGHALREAPASVIDELEDRGDSDSCAAWDEVAEQVKPQKIRNEVVSMLRGWADAAENHRRAGLCEDSQELRVELRRLRIARTPERLREWADAIDATDWREDDWGADEVTVTLGQIDGDLHGLDLHTSHGHWTYTSRIGLRLTIELDTAAMTEALRDRLIDAVELHCHRTAAVPRCLIR